MESNEMETSRWVDEKLTALNAGAESGRDAGSQPNAARAWSRIRAQRPVARRSRWTWAGATVLAGGLGSMAFPAPRAVMAERVWAPCVGACENLFAGKAAEGHGAGNLSGIGAPAPDF